MCKVNGCCIKPYFNIEGELKALFCASHKKEGMVNVISKTCLECKKQPNYNKEGEAKALYCTSHKKEGMVNVISKTCLECKKIPKYNKEGEPNALYCTSHKKEGMVNVISKTCLECKKQPNYNKEGEAKALYCTSHKKEGMVNVISKTCLECKKRPNYNKEGEAKALYCASHKKDGMVNVKDKTCLECKKIPKYNKEGEPNALYCASHKKEGMVNVMNKTCLECKKQPVFNKEGEPNALYCASHKKEGMVDVMNKTCKSAWCSTQVGGKYDGFCLFCYMNLFPDKPVSRNYKTKEYAVVEYVKEKFSQYDWIADKKVAGGCSKRRPDLLLDLGDQILIVEVDENQHSDYGCSCENKRIMELSQDLGHRPIVFIRFNPDGYESKETTVSSCWGQSKKGVCVVKKSKEKEWVQRLDALQGRIQYWTENKTIKTVEIVQLFYDF
jgi:hypothetical protein